MSQKAIISNRCFVANTSIDLVKELTGEPIYRGPLWGMAWLSEGQRSMCKQSGAEVLWVGAIGLGTDGPDPDWQLVQEKYEVA